MSALSRRIFMKLGLIVALAAVALPVCSAPAHRGEKILFIGSSTIGHWVTLKADFPEFNPINEGVNGTTYQYLIENGAALMRRHRPARVVIYSGDNDLANGEKPDQVALEFEKTVAVLRGVSSKIAIDVISVKPCPGRANLLPQVRAANELLKTSAASLNVTYIDTFTPMISKTGAIRIELFDQADTSLLHMNAEGYKLWTAILRKELVR